MGYYGITPHQNNIYLTYRILKVHTLNAKIETNQNYYVHLIYKNKRYLNTKITVVGCACREFSIYLIAIFTSDHSRGYRCLHVSRFKI